MKKMITLNQGLADVFKELDMTDIISEYEIQKAYNEVVGQLIEKLTIKFKVNNRILKVHIASAALRQELTMRKTFIIEEINKKFSKSVIDEAIFW